MTADRPTSHTRQAILLVLPMAVLATGVALGSELARSQPDLTRAAGLGIFVVVFPLLFVWLWRRPASLTRVSWLMWTMGAVYITLRLATVLWKTPEAQLAIRLAEVLPWLWVPYLFAFALLPTPRALASSIVYALALFGVSAFFLWTAPAGSLQEGISTTLLTHTTLSPALAMTMLVFVRRVRVEHLLETVRAASLKDMANTDRLTGLPNRRAVHACFQALTQLGHSGGLLLFDLDRFKNLNDEYGHEAGDAVLRSVALAARAAVRPGDTVARWGGEEFLVLLPGCPADGARVIAERVRSRIEQTVSSPGGAVTASVGVATVQPGEALDLVVGRADRAMYQAKRDGRNRVRTG